VVLLGTPTEDASRLYAMTVTTGDPSWAGALASIFTRHYGANKMASGRPVSATADGSGGVIRYGAVNDG
jgi:hypothetical protein